MSTPKPLTQAEMYQATGLGPEWELIWEDPAPGAERDHLCGVPTGAESAYRGEWVRVPYAATGTPGVQAAKCERCRIAWVRAVRGGKESPPAV